MVFLMSILVFLAGIMTYMFFPRNDQFQINMYEEEGNIVTFLNQHQAAKDYLYQMIKWQPETQTPEPYGLASDNLKKMLPNIMSGMHDISDNQDDNTIISNIPEEGYFTSSVICLDETNELANCPTDKQYVMTYGYTPNWWSSKTNQKQAWLKSMLKRSHGSDNCGILEGIGKYYAINNGQKYGGIVKAPIGGKMQKVLPDTLSKWIDEKFTEDRDILICLSSIKDVYKGTPVFQWDSINNNGDRHVADIGKPLTGIFGSANTLKGENKTELTLESYSISGIINGHRTDGAEYIYIYINGTQNIKETCTNGNCTLSAGNVSIDVPLGTSYAFTYSTSAGKETLTVNYSEIEAGKSNWKKKTVSSVETGPAFSADAKLNYIENNNRPYLLGLRIYDGILSKKDINHNIKADKKRFGL